MSEQARAAEPMLSRRALLTGGAGLVIGAGATEAGNLLTSGSTSTVGPHIPSPGEELMTEHGVLKRVLLAYRAAAEQIAAGHTPPAGAVTDAAQIISQYVESFHEGLEEAYVFPRVRAAEPHLIRTLLVQHDRGRHITAELLSAVSEGLSHTGARDRARGLLESFVRMYEPHEAWEDTVIYPALQARTSQRTLDELAERFAELENKQIGDHALGKILQRVSGVEQQLGIGDLDSFTPKP